MCLHFYVLPLEVAGVPQHGAPTSAVCLRLEPWWSWRGWGQDLTGLSMTCIHTDSQYSAWCLNSCNCCWQSQLHIIFSIWQFVETLFWVCHNIFHLPVTKYQKLTPQASGLQPYSSPLCVPFRRSGSSSEWETTALDKQTCKHSCNYALGLIIEEETLKSNSVAQLQSLWQHHMYQSKLSANNMAGESYENGLCPRKSTRRKMDDWTLSAQVASPLSSLQFTDFTTHTILELHWRSPKQHLSTALLPSVKITFTMILKMLSTRSHCGNHPANDVSWCRSITAAALSDAWPSLSVEDTCHLSYYNT